MAENGAREPIRQTESRAQVVLKRSIDVIVATTAVTGLIPVAGIVAVMIRMSMGPPILFRQWRLGHRGSPFLLYKFRTMSRRTKQNGKLLSDDERMSPLGRFLRRTSLDEIPELINVLRGDMSIVGPRPLLPEYRALYTAEQWRRHNVRPGIAGPVLAAGRNALSWERKFELDLWYVDNWSLKLDAVILVATLRTVLSGKGVTAEGHASMPRFQGSPAVGNDTSDA